MFVVRLLMATIAGGAVGLERETSNKSAGLRTNTLVAVGACIYVLIAGRVIDGSDGDPTRIVGQIVTGIGFLGAGVILHRGTNVRGLTTAATVWCSAALGCLAGFGMYWELAVSTAMVILINLSFKKMDKWFIKDRKEKKQGGNEDFE